METDIKENAAKQQALPPGFSNVLLIIRYACYV